MSTAGMLESSLTISINAFDLSNFLEYDQSDYSYSFSAIDTSYLPVIGDLPGKEQIKAQRYFSSASTVNGFLDDYITDLFDTCIVNSMAKEFIDDIFLTCLASTQKEDKPVYRLSLQSISQDKLDQVRKISGTVSNKLSLLQAKKDSMLIHPFVPIEEKSNSSNISSSSLSEPAGNGKENQDAFLLKRKVTETAQGQEMFDTINAQTSVVNQNSVVLMDKTTPRDSEIHVKKSILNEYNNMRLVRRSKKHLTIKNDSNVKDHAAKIVGDDVLNGHLGTCENVRPLTSKLRDSSIGYGTELKHLSKQFSKEKLPKASKKTKKKLNLKIQDFDIFKDTMKRRLRSARSSCSKIKEGSGKLKEDKQGKRKDTENIKAITKSPIVSSKNSSIVKVKKMKLEFGANQSNRVKGITFRKAIDSVENRNEQSKEKRIKYVFKKLNKKSPRLGIFSILENPLKSVTSQRLGTKRSAEDSERLPLIS